MLDRIAQAERRGTSAEARAREAADLAEPLPNRHDGDLRPARARRAGRAGAAGRHRMVPRRPEPESAGDPPTPGQVAINTATYEELRTLGLSVTQTGRILAYRERIGGFGKLDDLDQIPGFPQSFLDDLKSKIVI